MWITFVQIVIGLSIFLAIWSYLPVLWGAPWVPSSRRVIEQMLSLAELKPGQELVDLGAGDGRIVIAAVKTYDVRATGVEIDPLRCAIARILIGLTGTRDQAKVICGNMHAYNCQSADVVTLYLLQGTNQKLKEQLSTQLKPGAKIVTRTFSLEGWAPVVIDEKRKIFVYEMGKVDEQVRTEFV